VETHGTAAHGALPHLGRNAVHSMAAIIEAFESDYRAQLAKRKHPLLGQATSNLGVIRGGTQANIVPAHCFIEIDRRTLPGETEADVKREVNDLFKKHKLRAEVSFPKTAPCLPMETDPGLPLVRQFMKCVDQTKPQGAQYFCDAAVLSAAGIPSVVFGPGDIAHAHGADEWLELDQLERARRILVEFLHSLP
jgi:succinyl-diaminopimelate desuccinylase